MFPSNIISQLCPDLTNGQQYVIVDHLDGFGPRIVWTIGTPDPRVTPEAIAALEGTPDPKTAGQILQAVTALFLQQPEAVQAALGPIATSVLMFLQFNNAPAAKLIVIGAVNPALSSLSAPRFTALQAALLACF